MREILFRGKSKYNGKWIEGYFVINHLFSDTYFISDTESIMHRIIPETVGQYTGLKDKNGTKIFEGDILLDTQSGAKVFMKWFEKYGCFAFANGNGSMEWKYTDIFIEDMEIVGNIHDNPESLEYM